MVHSSPFVDPAFRDAYRYRDQNGRRQFWDAALASRKLPSHWPIYVRTCPHTKTQSYSRWYIRRHAF